MFAAHVAASTARCCLVVLVLVVLAVSPASAVLINVDADGFFGTDDSLTYSGAAAIGSAGDFWNSIKVEFSTVNSVLASGLKQSDGTTTGVSLLVEGFDNSGTTPTNMGADDSNPTANNLFRDNIFVDGGSAGLLRFTIDGLDPGATYDLLLYADYINDDGAEFTIGGDSLVATGGGGGSSFIEGVSYVRFSGIVPTGTQIIGFVDKDPGDPSGSFSGLQLLETQVPEPASFTLLALGGLLLGRRGSRRARSARRG